jgi:release factor glutamine methyltransferase
MTIGAVLREATARLAAVSDSAAMDAGLMLAHLVECDRVYFLVHGDEPLDESIRLRFHDALVERERGRPVPYIIGTAGFYGRTFDVDGRVLVPRPETELLVEAAIAHLRRTERVSGVAADIGTGSGIIAISLACELASLNVFATDISREALSVARKNAARNNVFQHISFMHGDLGEPLRRFGRYDAVVANLPYVPTHEIAAAPDPVSHEPRLALDGGGAGLDLYERLVPTLEELLAPGGAAFLEAAPANVVDLALLVRHRWPSATVEVKADYSALPRFVSVIAPG